MRLVDAARARLALLFGRRGSETRMDTEIAFHIEMEAERLVREEGLEPAEAARRARIAFGGVEKHKEALRDGRGLRWLSGLSLDLKLGARMLIRYPGLTLVGAIGMAVAVAIGSVSFSALYGVIDATLPFDGGDRIVAIRSIDALTGTRNATALHDLAIWREGLAAVEEIGAYRTIDRNLIVRNAVAQPVRIAEMSASGFRITRVAPLMGRFLTAGDERRGAPSVVVIGYDVWQAQFAGAADVIGKTLWLGADAFTVIGVMPQGFAFPINNRVWTPLLLDPSAFERGKAPPLEVFGRLAHGASLRDAQKQIITIGQRLAATYPATNQRARLSVSPYTQFFRDAPDTTWAFHLAQVLVTMLLVVIGTNVAVLVYARTASRAGELAVRIALGASRERIIAQLFAEALVLSGLAAALGLVIARIALQYANALLTRMGGEQFPFWLTFGITPGVVAYAAGLTVLGAVIVGVAPAIKATRSRVHANLQELSGGAAIRVGRSWTVMIVAQVAVAVLGIPFATTAIRGIRASVDPRFAATQFLVARVRMDGDDRPVDATKTVAGKISRLGAVPVRSAQSDQDPDVGARFSNLRGELARRLAAEPGVTRVVFSSQQVGNERDVRYEVERDSVGGTQATTNHAFRANGVEPGFFAAFDVPVLIGRGFNAGDATASPVPVMVNESFVRNVFAGTNPLGRRVREVSNGRGDNVHREAWQTIVGVVPDFPTLTDTSVGIQPRLYWPLQPNDGQAVVLNVRVAGSSPVALASRLREIALELSPSLRLVGVSSLIDSMHEAMEPMRLGLTALLLVVGSVLLLSAAGMYALMSLTVTRRRREIGIRTALGAGSGRVVMSILVKAATQIAVGVALGFAALLLIVAVPQHGRLSGGQFVDLLTTVAVMGAVGLVAAVGPARRALRIQPTEALKSE